MRLARIIVAPLVTVALGACGGNASESTTATTVASTTTTANGATTTAPPATTVERLTVHDVGFDGAYVAPSKVNGRRHAILALGGSEGGLSTLALAQAGTPTLAVAYFGGADLPPRLVSIPLEYFTGAVRWLASRPE